MRFVGIDLTSAFAAAPRPIDIAVLDDRLNVTFFNLNWPAADVVTGRDPGFLTEAFLNQIQREPDERIVLAIDGPQGLAIPGNTMRQCERILGTPGRTPSNLPPAEEAGDPFQGYIRSSIDLFSGLVNTVPHWPLAGLNDVENVAAGLWEVFPGAEWVVLARRRLPSKASLAGRQVRRRLFEALHVVFPTEAVPTADQNDALVGAFLAWCVQHQPQSVELVGDAPNVLDGEIREGFILHAGSDLGFHLPIAELEVANPGPEAERDWNGDCDLLLMLTDYGLVHGTEPENAWLVPGQNYTATTVPPHAPLNIQLNHAPNFPGGHGWTADPTVQNVLVNLGFPIPQHLGRQNAVALRVVVH